MSATTGQSRSVSSGAKTSLEIKQADAILIRTTQDSRPTARVALPCRRRSGSQRTRHFIALRKTQAWSLHHLGSVALLTILLCCFPLCVSAAQGASVPALSVSPTSQSFGYVVVGTPETQAITLKSTGTAAVEIKYASVSVPGFRLLYHAFPFTLQPGQQTTLSLQFDPSVVGVATGQVIITSTSSTNPKSAVDIWGKGRPKPAALSALACGSALETGAGTDACTVTLSAAAPSGGLLVSLSSSNAAVKVPATVTVPAKATSAGFTATVSAVSSTQTALLTASAGGVSKSFGIQLNAVTPVSVTLTPASVSLTASRTQTFTATVANTTNTAVTWSLSPAVGSISAAGLYTAPASITTAQSVTVTATSVANPAISAHAAVQLNPSTPTLNINATSISFGSVVVKTTTTQQVTLTSAGTSPVTVSAATVTGAGFTMSGVVFPITLNPTQVATLNVVFHPTVTGVASGQLTITSNSTTNATAVIPLSATVVAASYTVDLSWAAPTSSPDPVAGYNIYRSPSGSSTYARLNSSGNTATAYVDSTVQSGLSYDYIVDSVDAAGVESVPSNMIVVVIP